MTENKSPWGGNTSSGQSNRQENKENKTPPNVEFLFKKKGSSFNGLPPLPFKKGSLLLLGLLLLFAVWALTGFYIVDAKEQGVVLRFGKHVATSGPGLHYHLPYPIEKAYTPNVMQENRIEIGTRTIDPSSMYKSLNNSSFSSVNNLANNGNTQDIYEESMMLTGDENIVEINFTVTWKIKNAADFLFNVNDPANTVRIAAESAMRDIVAQTPIQDIMTEKRDEVQAKVQNNLQKLLDMYRTGVSITAVQMQKVDPPAQVADAFYDVQRARADMEKMRNDAEAYRNNIIPTARGDAIKMVQDAEAYKEKVVNIATGEVSRFNALLTEYERSPAVTAKKMYIEAMEKILTGTNKMLVDPKLSGLLPVLPVQNKGVTKQ